MNEHDSVSTSRPSLCGKLVKFIGRFLATIALMPLHPLSGQTPWPSDPSGLNLQIRETLFSSRWGRQPSEAEISQAQDRVKQSVLLVEPVSTETRTDGTVVVAKRELLDISIAKKHALYLKPGEVGCGVNQVLLIAEFETSEEIASPGKPSQKLQESYHSVFRLIASGDDRDRFEFQFEFSKPGRESETTCAEVFAERWYDFSAMVVESTPRPVVPTVETEGNSWSQGLPKAKPPIGMPDLPAIGVIDRWWDGVSRYVGWHLITPGLPEAIKLGVETPAGAVITSVNPGSPAEKAGMARGDVVAFFDGLEIDTPEDLEALIIQAEIGSRHTVRLNSFTKFLTYDAELTIEQDRRDREDHSEYAHPELGWSLRFPRDWKLDPYAKRHESSGKVYDSIKSPHGNYELHFYHDTRSVEEKDTALSQFIAEAQKSFGDHHIGRVALGKIPVAFVAGPVGETERKILIRIAMVVEDRLCEIDVLAHPLAAFESLPRAVSGILGTMNGQSRNR